MKPVSIIHKDYLITTDKNKMQPEAVHAWLAHESYWAKNIPLDVVVSCIEHSFCAGIIKDGQQVGFARLVTDYTTFGYLADVFVTAPHREQGLAGKMIELLMGLPWVQNLRRIMLATHDAHELYTRFGFVAPAIPERYMELCRPVIYDDAHDVLKN